MSDLSLTGAILVIDDDKAFQALVESVLIDDGHRVVCVRTGEEALKLLETERPLVIVLDGLLPGMRGDDVARKIRVNHPRGELPIIFCSAFFRDLKSYEHLTRNCGVDVVLHKPLDRDALRAEVARATGHDAGEDIHVEHDEPIAAPAPPDITQLRAEYLADARARTVRMRDAVPALAGPAAAEARTMLRTEGHRFKGSGASFGIEEISRLGGEIEDLLVLHETDPEIPAPARARLFGLVDALARKVAVAVLGTPLPVRRTVVQPARMLLLDGKTDLQDLFAASAAGGDALEVCGNVDDAVRAALQDRPSVVFIAGDREEIDAGEACEKLRAAGVGPLVVLGSGHSVHDRLTFVARGADGYVGRPPDLEACYRLADVYARAEPGARVLAVDPDKLLLEAVSASLAAHGVAVDPCVEAAQFLAALEATGPALVVLGADQDSVSGLELLKLMRADPVHRRIPVLLLSSSGSGDERVAAYRAGADDVLVRPFDPDELTARVLRHLEQRSFLDREAPHDPRTGLARRRHLREVAERSVQLARRGGRQLALLGVDVNVDELAAQHGRYSAESVVEALAAHLRASFRGSDLVARLGTGRIAALLHDITPGDAQRLLLAELTTFGARSFGGPRTGPFRPRLHGAWITFPEQTGNADALIAALERKLAEQGMVVPAEAPVAPAEPTPPEPVETADDSHPLASMNWGVEAARR